MPYFDQLFERLPNGSYRERTKPVAPDPNGHRFVKSEKTGRICVMLPPISLKEAIRTGMATFEKSFGLVGGDWGSLPKTNAEWNADRAASWNELVSWQNK